MSAPYTRTSEEPAGKPVEELETVVIRFAGDSGDGMQLTGSQFTNESALAGNDIATLPDFPAEIRAPAGTLAGVSGFQLHFSSHRIFTPGDQPDVLVVMNPAALAVNIDDLHDGGAVIADSDGFSPANLRKAGYTENPLDSEALRSRVRVIAVPMTRMTAQALSDLNLPNKAVVRCKNFFALGLCAWLFNRPTEATLQWVEQRFRRVPELAEANARAFRAGWNFGETSELFAASYRVAPATIAPGRYTNITGNKALAYGFMAAAAKAEKPLFYASYPITPASDVLHELASHKEFGVVTFQAEDEIAAAGAALGAAFGGAVGVSASSGPGISLKAETLGLAVMVELPMVVVNIQRGGPSTGLPTKTEQADLLQALYGRHGECPMPVLAAYSPTDCFDAAFEAVRVAIKYMTPVLLLSDGFLANGSKPWRLPAFSDLPEIPAKLWTNTVGFQPYLRDEDSLSRPWAVPGTPGLEHRIGGLEKDFDSGNISYHPANHERMVRVRAMKVERIADALPPVEVYGDEDGDVLIIGWGSTYGAIREAVDRLREQGLRVGHAHVRWLSPLQPGLEEAVARYRRVIVPELNLGQLVRVIRERFLVDAIALTKVQGQPFKAAQLVERIRGSLADGREPRE